LSLNQKKETFFEDKLSSIRAGVGAEEQSQIKFIINNVPASPRRQWMFDNIS
jgi:hypothetical protein